MALNQKGSQLLISNLKKAGVKVIGSSAKAAARLAPLAWALALYSDVEKIPGIGDVLKFTREAQNWVYNNTLGKIPVLGWFTRKSSDALEDLFGISRPEGIGKRNYGEEKEGEEQSENDADWYGGQLDLPVNVNRALGFNYTDDLFDYPTLGGVPKMNVIQVEMFEFSHQPEFNNNISYLFETMKLNLKSNITYTLPQVKAFMLNNITLYILAKLLERRLGFMKYKDEQFPQFHELWQYQINLNASYDVLPINKDPNYDIQGERYSMTLDIYESLVKDIYQVVLPENMKKWIDHYFGSVFLLDNDVMNKKVSYMIPKVVYLYDLTTDRTDVQIMETIPVVDLSPSILYDLCDKYFNTNLIQNIRTDMLKQNNLKEVIRHAKVVPGWLTSMKDYNPVLTYSETYKQMVINGYTTTKAVGKDGAIRLDVTTGGAQDLATAILALGAVVPSSVTNLAQQVFKVKPLSIVSSLVVVYADNQNKVKVPKGFFQSAVDEGGAVTFVQPFQMVYTSDVSADIYLQLTESSAGGGDPVKVFYPSVQYPNSVPSATERYVQFNASNMTAFLGKSSFNQAYYDNETLYTDFRGFIPVGLVAGHVVIGLMTNDSFSQNLPTQDTVVITDANLSTYFTLKSFDRNVTYNGILARYRGWTLGQIYDLFSDRGLAFLPVDMFGNASETFSIEIGSITYTRAARYSGTTLEYLNFQVGSTNLTASIGRTQASGDLEWITSVMYPASSLTQEYILTTAPVSNYTMSAIAGFIHYAEYLFSAIGYSIPVYPTLNIHIMNPNSEEVGVFTYADTLLKEDYVPMIIRQADLPAVWNTMFRNLLSFDTGKIKATDDSK